MIDTNILIFDKILIYYYLKICIYTNLNKIIFDLIDGVLNRS